MFRTLSMTAAIAVACACASNDANAQFSGVSVQVGGYGTGVRVGTYNYGNGYYNTYGNGYRSGYGNQIYASPYVGPFNGGHISNSLPYISTYPSYGYRSAAPTIYTVPRRVYPIRRFRFR
jgi:hypothetical protein